MFFLILIVLFNLFELAEQNSYQTDSDLDERGDVCEITINYVLGYGGRKLFGQDYNTTYTLIPQPTKKYIGQDFNVILGRPFD